MESPQKILEVLCLLFSCAFDGNHHKIYQVALVPIQKSTSIDFESLNGLNSFFNFVANIDVC